MKHYIKPQIKIRHIIEEQSMLAASGEGYNNNPSDDLGNSTKSGTVNGGNAMSKQNSIWNLEEE